MKRLIPALVIVLVVIGAGAWLAISLRAKWHYARLRTEVVQHSFSVLPMNEDITTLLAEVRAEWEERHSQVGGPHSDGLESIGMHPCVANLVEACSYQLPEYSFLSPNQNRRATVMAIYQLTIFAPSMDQSLHVSDDGHLAVIRCGTNCVYVFSDEDAGLREALYYLKAEDIEPENAGD